jgi:hypothetical protein
LLWLQPEREVTRNEIVQSIFTHRTGELEIWVFCIIGHRTGEGVFLYYNHERNAFRPDDRVS